MINLKRHYDGFLKVHESKRAKVFKARDKENDFFYAIKISRKLDENRVVGDPEFEEDEAEEQFDVDFKSLREITALKNLRHPGVVK